MLPLPRLILLALCLLVCAEAHAATERPPNIVFIFADDWGWGDLSCHGHKQYRTPNIDQMAAEGLRLTDGYSCGPNCQPTRAALMSGQYAPRTGVYTVGSVERFAWRTRSLRPVENAVKLPLTTYTLGQAVRDAGYVTGHFGKWHLGQDEAHHPLKRGFDEAIVSMGKHFDFETSPRVDYPEGTYLADFLTDKAVDFIARHKDRPFYLELHHYAVHAPYQAKPELTARFVGTKPVGGHHDPVYAAMIASVDESVGRVLKTIDDLGLGDDTLVIFTSDNGGLSTSEGSPTSNAPLRAGKGWLYEGGIRVPLIVRWPGVVKPGSTSSTPVISTDYFPTILAAIGAPSHPEWHMDGMSLLPLLKQSGELTARPLYWHYPHYGNQGGTPGSSVRAGDYKLIEFFEDGRLELYYLKKDPGEKTNVLRENRATAEPLHTQLIAWRKEVQAPMPTPQKPSDGNPMRGKRKSAPQRENDTNDS